MARNQKKAKIALILVVVICCGYWLNRSGEQNHRLEQIEELGIETRLFIKRGELRKAQSTLDKAVSLSNVMQNEWAAYPYIRERERALTSHLADLRDPYIKRLALLDTTVLKVAQALVSGKIEDAKALIASALSGDASADKSLQVLNRMVERLWVQDFKAANSAVKQFVNFLTKEVPISESTSRALPELTASIEREEVANQTTHKRIATEVRQLIDTLTYHNSEGFRPFLKGKVMIWDATSDQVDLAYQSLPEHLRASPKDEIITFLTVIKREQITHGYYSVSREPAYKEKVTIGIVYWPEYKNAGTVIIWGSDPPPGRPVTYKPGFGSSVKIVSWVASLPSQ